MISNIFFRIASVEAEGAEANGVTQTIQVNAVREVPKNEKSEEEANSLFGQAGCVAFLIHEQQTS